uniref:Uncharacterized protein n=3 Tax=Meloidogyne TaxID=189290 RepID=A0A914M4V7_MELIC
MSWSLFSGMGMVNFNPAMGFPPNAHQIVTMQQNAQQLAAQQQQQQQQAQQQQQQQQQQVIKREPAAPTMAPSAGVQQQSNSSNNSASAAAAAGNKKTAAAQNMEFMATVQNKDLLEELKVQSQAIVHKTITNGTPDGRQQMIRHYRCNRHRHQEKCPFKMLAIQSDDGTFKVFRSGEHNHAVVPSGGQRTSWIPHATVRTADELETLRQGQRVTVHKTTFHGKNRHFRCNRHRHNERCMFKLLAVTENNGTINVFRSGEHNHPIQQISNCVY